MGAIAVGLWFNHCGGGLAPTLFPFRPNMVDPIIQSEHPACTRHKKHARLKLTSPRVPQQQAWPATSTNAPLPRIIRLLLYPVVLT